MARKRPEAFKSSPDKANGQKTNGHAKPRPDDVENAISSARRPNRFRDIARVAVTHEYHAQLKRKLIDDVQRGSLEHYRKSPEEIQEIKNKKIRAFYEGQNERLNDWLEVDTVVQYIADDVLDSMDPQDLDGDGVAERRGALHDTGDRIHEMLPDDEREKRRKAERNARWAINVRIDFQLE